MLVMTHYKWGKKDGISSSGKEIRAAHPVGGDGKRRNNETRRAQIILLMMHLRGMSEPHLRERLRVGLSESSGITVTVGGAPTPACSRSVCVEFFKRPSNEG
jgi:hypothetical protein